MGNRYADLKEAVDPWSEKGYRVLLVAEYGGVPDQKGLDPRRVSPWPWWPCPTASARRPPRPSATSPSRGWP